MIQLSWKLESGTKDYGNSSFIVAEGTQKIEVLLVSREVMINSRCSPAQTFFELGHSAAFGGEAFFPHFILTFL